MSVVRLDTFPSEFRCKIAEAKSALVGASGTLLDVVGQIQIPVKIGTYQTEQVFTVVNTLTVDCLLGADYLVTYEVIIDYKHSHVAIKGHEIPFTLTHGIANFIQPPINMVICADKNVTIPGRTVQLVDVLLPKELRKQDVNSIKPTDNTKLPQHLMVAKALSPVLSGRSALLQMMNSSPTAATIYKGTKVGIATPLSELLMVDAIEQSSMSQPASNVDLTESMSQFDLNVDFTESDLSTDQQWELLALLHQYRDLFAIKDQPLGRTSVVKHTIYTEGPPIWQPVRH
ncbi:uncharacterized protein [Dysidea avara]|uniref:uncharacterized protein n=1 Tax=Dysidea avara TaxID=196820 RepID=UPI00331C6F82